MATAYSPTKVAVLAYFDAKTYQEMARAAAAYMQEVKQWESPFIRRVVKEWLAANKNRATETERGSKKRARVR